MDALLAFSSGRLNPTSGDWNQAADKGKVLVGKSTLSRLELTPTDVTQNSRYKKMVPNAGEMDYLLIDVFLELIVLDVNATLTLASSSHLSLKRSRAPAPLALIVRLAIIL